MQDQEDIMDFLRFEEPDDYWNTFNPSECVIPTNIKYCFKHIECRGMSKCLGLVTVYWNRLLDWLCTI